MSEFPKHWSDVGVKYLIENSWCRKLWTCWVRGGLRRLALKSGEERAYRGQRGETPAWLGSPGPRWTCCWARPGSRGPGRSGCPLWPRSAPAGQERRKLSELWSDIFMAHEQKKKIYLARGGEEKEENKSYSIVSVNVRKTGRIQGRHRLNKAR